MSPGRRAPELLDRAAAADLEVWRNGGLAEIALRNHAVEVALDAGWTEQELAERLRVRPEDILRWRSRTG